MADNLVTTFLDAEREESLFELMYHQFPLWPFLRLELFRMIESTRNGFCYSPVYERQLPKSAADRQPVLCENIGGCDYLVITNRHRLVSVNGESICPVTSMFRGMNARIRTLYHDYGKADDVMTTAEDRIDGIPYDFSGLPLFSDAEDPAALDRLKRFCLRFLPDVSCCIVMERVRCMISYVSHMSRLSAVFHRLLNAFRPNILFFSSAYAIANMFFIGAAKEHGIPAVEIQHGLIGDTHVAYNSFCRNVPQQYYPDCLLTYGAFDRDVPRHLIPKNGIFVVGNKLLDELSGMDRRDKSGILVVGNISNNDSLLQLAGVLKEACPNEIVTYRAHAEEANQEEALQRLRKKRIEISNDARVSIYQLLLQHKWVIGTLSTVLLEALRFHCCVCVLEDPTLADAYNLAQRELPMLTQKEIEDVISGKTEWAGMKADPFRFYGRFSEERVDAVLRRIMEKRLC